MKQQYEKKGVLKYKSNINHLNNYNDISKISDIMNAIINTLQHYKFKWKRFQKMLNTLTTAFLRSKCRNITTASPAVYKAFSFLGTVTQ